MTTVITIDQGMRNVNTLALDSLNAGIELLHQHMPSAVHPIELDWDAFKTTVSTLDTDTLTDVRRIEYQDSLAFQEEHLRSYLEDHGIYVLDDGEAGITYITDDPRFANGIELQN